MCWLWRTPDLRVYWVDPGDMRTTMHQEAFPGEDIGDRPLPEGERARAAGCIGGRLPGGRYQARSVPSRRDLAVHGRRRMKTAAVTAKVC